MDTTYDPCENFFEYACGGWLESATIPEGDFKASRGYQGGEIQQKIMERQKDILAGDWPILSEYYTSCLDMEARANFPPVLDSLLRSWTSVSQNNFGEFIAELHTMEIALLFSFSVGADFTNPSVYLASLSQAGIGLPSVSYYLETGDQETQGAYKQHIQNLFDLWDVDTAPSNAGDLVFEFEQMLVEMFASQSRYSEESYNPTLVIDLEELYPGVNLTQYLTSIGYDANSINVVQPSYFEQLSSFLDQVFEDPDLRAQLTLYGQWQTLHAFAPLLSAEFTQADHDFFNGYLKGSVGYPALSDSCVQILDSSYLGMFLAQYYIFGYYNPEVGEVADAMWEFILEYFMANLYELEWLDDATRQEALLKAQNMRHLIGHPEEWPTIPRFELSPTDLYTNSVEMKAHGFSEMVALAEQPLDPNRWAVTPTTVTAYNNISPNEIVTPAGIMNNPFFALELPVPMQFGGLGMVLGHELTHGFDNTGRHFDAQGIQRDWWSPESAAEFEKRASCFADQYSQFEVLPGVFIDGNFTLGENIADNGGIQQAYYGYKKWTEQEHSSSYGNEKSDFLRGISHDQEFFIGYAQAWCFSMTPEYADYWVKTNSHSTPPYRVLGSLQNFREFSAKFNCNSQNKYSLEDVDRCSLW
eukprot:NODE_93_length_2341_cov_73.284553_g72_i0.p1 GENE.NODE_93_length_2341_cov_73.284553_g72_i0~~NODE_93_length_2341_cov_73.284553_g72_i0.p1  ORF type:complete len:642 (-),score=83.13 NODE_93_length_2341_cov_73.284553_g72_i0:61-1986(-)